jgi:hypothetical protein
MLIAIAGQPFALSAFLADGAGTFYPQAKIYDSVGTLVATINLTAQTAGIYGGAHTLSTPGYYTAHYVVYTDSGHSTPAAYDPEAEIIHVQEEHLPEDLLDVLLNDHLLSGTVGEALALIRGLVQHNFVLKNPTYNASGLMTAATIAIYKTKAELEADDPPFATFSVSATEVSGKPELAETYTVKKN